MALRFGSAGFDEAPASYGILAVMAAYFLLNFFGLQDTLTPTLAWVISPAWFATLQFWQPFSFPFVHTAGNFFGLLWDAMAVFFFATSLESSWGTVKFLVFFFGSGLLAGFAVLGMSTFGHPGIFLGLAGSFVAIAVAWATLNPYATVLLFFVIPVQARFIALIVFGFEVFLGFGRYGGPIPALVANLIVAAFAYLYAARRTPFTMYGSSGLSLRERFERWQQRRRMREWQKRASRAAGPDDLFKKK